MSKGTKTEPKIPEPPDYLGEIARKFWNQTAEYLVDMDLLTQIDFSTFGDYCLIHEHTVRLHKKIEKEGYKFKTPNGHQQKKPEITTLRDFLDQKLKLARELGLTPAARSDINLSESEGSTNNVEKILNKMGKSKNN